MKPRFSPLDLTMPPLEGVNLIEASAGTGKTYAICAIVIHLLLEKSIPIEKILVVTFTVAATEELKGRIRAMLRKSFDIFKSKHVPQNDRDYELLQRLFNRYGTKPDVIDLLKTALHNFDRAPVFTIHGFCQRMLMENAFESSSLFDTELLADANILIDEAAKDFWRKKMYTAGKAFVRYAATKEFTPSALSALAKIRPLDPKLIILPDQDVSDITKIDNEYTQLEEMFNSLKTIWDSSREEICSQIEAAIDARKLNGRKYQKRYMKDRIAQMNSFLQANEVLSTNYSKIEYFSFSLLNEKTVTIAHPFCQKLDEFLKEQNELLNDLDGYLISLKKEFIQEIESYLSSHRLRKNVRTFEDLLTSMYHALKGDSNSSLAHRIRTRFHAALIDEFQDTDPLQYEIFSLVFRNHCPLYMIGDPKQAIYKFRGADIFAYLRASSQCDNRFTLPKNYRSHPDLVHAINAIFGIHKSTLNSPFVIEGIEYNQVKPAKKESEIEIAHKLPEGSPLTIWFITNTINSESDEKAIRKEDLNAIIPALIISEIKTLTEHGINPGEMAILVRKNEQSKALARALRTHGIPCVTYGTESVLESDEALHMERVMSSIAEPSNRSYLVAALTTDFFGNTVSAIAEIVNTEEKLAEYLVRFTRYREIWEQRGFITMFWRFMQENQIASHLASLEDGERKLTNLFHLAELIHRAEREHRFGIEGILKWFSEEKSLEADEIKLRLETDEYAVKILTIHKSKGLEFPIVFAPFLYDSAKIHSEACIYHDTSSDPEKVRTVLNLSTQNTEAQQVLTEELSESIRLMYVALTRAKVRCYTLWGNINQSDLSAPMYVFHSNRITSLNEFLESNTVQWANKSSDMLEDIQELETQSKRAISIRVISQQNIEKLAMEDEKKDNEKSFPALSCRNFNKSEIKQSWSLTSFSSLIFNAREDFHEKIDDEGKEENEARHLDFTIHTFPRGTQAGLFIHEVFENIDFQNPTSDESQNIIKDLLRNYRIDEQWMPIIRNNIQAVLNHPLKSENATFCLAEITPSMRIHELEFYFPASKISPGKLAELIIGNYSDHPERKPIFLSRLGLEETQGFVRGFIDLVFTIHGKWFLVDWKSNHLGDSAESYRKENLYSAMLEKHYFLQCHLYAVALHRHLTRTLPGYKYDDHFGGIFYFFIRGIDAESPHTGVYFEPPSKQRITTLEDYLGREIA